MNEECEMNLNQFVQCEPRVSDSNESDQFDFLLIRLFTNIMCEI